MAVFQPAIARLLKDEGGYAPRDNKRGAVNFGITQKTYTESGYPARGAQLAPELGPWPAEVKHLTRPQAESFYWFVFYQPLRVGAVIDQALAELYFSLGVNCGIGTAQRWIQSAAGVRVDGKIGPQTLSAVNSHPTEVLRGLKSAALAHYDRLAIKDPKEYGDDHPGWMTRLAKLTGDRKLIGRTPGQVLA